MMSSYVSFLVLSADLAAATCRVCQGLPRIAIDFTEFVVPLRHRLNSFFLSSFIRLCGFFRVSCPEVVITFLFLLPNDCDLSSAPLLFGYSDFLFFIPVVVVSLYSLGTPLGIILSFSVLSDSLRND